MGLFDGLFGNSHGTPGFFIGKKGPIHPVEFGRDVVVSAIASSPQSLANIFADLKKITGDKPSDLVNILASNRGIVLMYLFTLESAAFFLYLVREQIPKDVLDGVMDGIKKRFSEFSKNNKNLTAPVSHEINDFLNARFQTCLRALNEEINSDEQYSFNSGTSATLVTDLLAKEFKLDTLFQSRDTGNNERMMFERHIAASGILFTLGVCPKLQITYK